MRLIYLGEKGKFAIVDAKRYKEVSKVCWRIQNSGYVMGCISGKDTLLHHLVLGFKEGFERDHKDRNKLNNLRTNLRYSTRSQNNFNKASAGVVKLKSGKWRACLCNRNLGEFESRKFARAIYCREKMKVSGEFACTSEVAKELKYSDFGFTLQDQKEAIKQRKAQYLKNRSK